LETHFFFFCSILNCAFWIKFARPSCINKWSQVSMRSFLFRMVILFFLCILDDLFNVKSWMSCLLKQFPNVCLRSSLLYFCCRKIAGVFIIFLSIVHNVFSSKTKMCCSIIVVEQGSHMSWSWIELAFSYSYNNW